MVVIVIVAVNWVMLLTANLIVGAVVIASIYFTIRELGILYKELSVAKEIIRSSSVRMSNYVSRTSSV